jgi:hypothetical protein
MNKCIKALFFSAAALCAVAVSSAQATTINFDDLNTRNNFGNLGISNTYSGFQWTSSGSFFEGWAVATTSNQAAGPTVPVSGQSYAWNWNGVQKLFVNFGGAKNVLGAHFAFLSPTYYDNSSTIQMFGYDAANNLVSTSNVLSLTSNFQFLNAAFSNVHSIEIRSDRNFSWFSVDDIQFGTVKDVAEPATIGVFSLTLLGLSALRRRKQK